MFFFKICEWIIINTSPLFPSTLVRVKRNFLINFFTDSGSYVASCTLRCSSTLKAKYVPQKIFCFEFAHHTAPTQRNVGILLISIFVRSQNNKSLKTTQSLKMLNTITKMFPMSIYCFYAAVRSDTTEN